MIQVHVHVQVRLWALATRGGVNLKSPHQPDDAPGLASPPKSFPQKPRPSCTNRLLELTLLLTSIPYPRYVIPCPCTAPTPSASYPVCPNSKFPEAFCVLTPRQTPILTTYSNSHVLTLYLIDISPLLRYPPNDLHHGIHRAH